MIHPHELGRLEPIYTFIDHETGANINVASKRLFDWCQMFQPKQRLIPVRLGLAIQFLRDNIVSLDRLKQLRPRFCRGEITPLIFANQGTTTNGLSDAMLVDGHHRYCLYEFARLSHCIGYLLDESQWRPFEIEGLPSITEAELHSIPITQRNY